MMKDVFCKSCGYLTFSKRKGRKVMCQCQVDEYEREEEHKRNRD